MELPSDRDKREDRFCTDILQSLYFQQFPTLATSMGVSLQLKLKMSEKKDERDGETEPFESEGSDPALKPQKRKRVASRFFNAVLALAFFFVFVMSLVSFSASSNSYRKLSGTESGGLGKACALNADYENDNDRSGSAGGDGACQFSIGGEVILTLYAALSLAVMIIKIIGGWSM